jgi:PAS domain S-box-containing protein
MVFDFLSSQIDYVFFLYGLSFFILAGVSFLLVKSGDKDISWFWLGLFGIFHALNEWSGLAALIIGNSFSLRFARLAVVIISFFCLIEFSRKNLNKPGLKIAGLPVYAAALFLVYLGWFYRGLRGAAGAAYFLIGFVAAFSASFIFFLLAARIKPKLKPWLALAGIVFGFYAFTQLVLPRPPHFFSATLLNQEVFFRSLGFPVQLLRCALAFLCSFALWQYWFFSQPWTAPLSFSKKAVYLARNISILAGLIILGWAVTESIGRHYGQLTRHDYIAKADTGAAAINFRRILALEASAADLGSSDYTRLKEQMGEIKKVNGDLSFVYLLRLRDGKIMFLADSGSPGTPGYSLPGKIYKESPAGLKEDFFKLKTFILGPYKNRWGNWFSVYAPVIDFETKDVISRVGMDIKAEVFRNKLFHHRLIGILITFGLFALLIGVFIIVELNKMAVNRLIYSQRHLQVLLNNIPNPVYYKNREGVYLGCNLALEGFLGVSRDKIIGKTVFDISLDQGEAEKYFKMDQELFKQPGIQVYESKLRNINGVERDVIFNKSTYPGPDGKVAGLVGVIIDITERKHAENTLRRLASIVESSDDAIIGEDPRGIITSWNYGAQKIYGYSAQEAIGQPIGLIIPPEKKEETGALLAKVNNNEHVQHYETVRLSKEGKRIDVSLTISPLKDNSGRITGASVIARDITGRVKSEMRINKLNKMQSSLFNPGRLDEKLKIIADGMIDIFEADFCRIWMIGPEDRCGAGCPYTSAGNKPVSCLKAGQCLHLVSSSDRQEDTDRKMHDRVPLECYGAGGIVSGKQDSFLSNNIKGDPRVCDREWADRQGLVSFAGFRLGLSGSATIGVLGVFSRHPVSSEEYALMKNIGNIAVRVINISNKEEEIKNNEEKFRAIYEGSYDARIILNEKGFLDCNRRALEMFGFASVEEFSKAGLGDISPEFQPDGRNSLAAYLEQIRSALGSGYRSFEWMHKSKDAKFFPAEVLLSKFRLTDGEYLQSTVRDITERRQAEELLEQAAEEWERTFNSISDLIFIQDKDFSIVKINKACSDALKLKPEEIIGKKCYEVFHHLNHPWPGCPSLQAQGDYNSHTEEVDDPRVGVPLLVTVSPILNARGELTGLVHVARDISERRKVENALREVIDMKTDFTSTVSHELRTPLAAIKEGISIVLDGISGPIGKDQKEFLDIARRNVDRLTRIINDILDFQKLESGKMVFNMQPNDINDTARETEKIMRGIIEKKGLALELELDESIPQVKFDRDRIMQVFANLLNNAVKFTEKGGINIRTEKAGNFITVLVKDTGIGIKDSDIPLLFERFKQLDAGMTRKTGGTGLGLSICRDIIQRHEGRIWAESSPGEGSIFGFTLPVT